MSCSCSSRLNELQFIPIWFVCAALASYLNLLIGPTVNLSVNFWTHLRGSGLLRQENAGLWRVLQAPAAHQVVVDDTDSGLADMLIEAVQVAEVTA